MKDQVILVETAIIANTKGFPFNNVIYPITQSLLQKWLREEYNIHLIIICPLFKNEKWECKTRYISKFSIPSHYYDKGNNYEDALEKGLQRALNTIK